MKKVSVVDLIAKSSITRFSEHEGGLKMSFYDRKEKLLHSKKLALITEAEAKKRGYGRMGPAGGQDLYHCLYIAKRYAKNFTARVVAYTVNNKPKNKEMKMEVIFWEEKKGK